MKLLFSVQLFRVYMCVKDEVICPLLLEIEIDSPQLEWSPPPIPLAYPMLITDDAPCCVSICSCISCSSLLVMYSTGVIGSFIPRGTLLASDMMRLFNIAHKHLCIVYLLFSSRFHPTCFPRPCASINFYQTMAITH